MGRKLAEYAHALGMRIIAVDPYTDFSELNYVEKYPDKETALPKADFVSVNVFASDETKHYLSTKDFSKMKPTAYLINTSRGSTVSEKDLIDALQNKTIAGAGLDVFEEEPPHKENPLFSLENVVLTPHLAGATAQAIKRMGLYAAMSIDDVLSGRIPRWPLNKI